LCFFSVLGQQINYLAVSGISLNVLKQLYYIS